jgi:ABC-type multidrug transport system ATPase subunit
VILKKTYNKKIIFQNLNIYLPKGKIIKIEGENGSGKSTLLRVISGITPFEKGNFYFEYNNGKFEKIKVDSRFYKKHINLSFQHTILKPQDRPVPALFNYLKFFNPKINTNNILFFLEKFNIKKEDQNKRIFQLSGGTKKKLELIKTILTNTDFMFFDEPLSGIDKNTSNYIKEYLIKLKNENKGIIICEHGNLLDDIVDELYNLKNFLLEVGKMNEKIVIEFEGNFELNLDEIKIIDGIIDTKIEKNENQKIEEIKNQIENLNNLNVDKFISINVKSDNENNKEEIFNQLKKIGIDLARIESVEYIPINDDQNNIYNKKLIVELKSEKKKIVLFNLIEYFENNKIKYKNITF